MYFNPALYLILKVLMFNNKAEKDAYKFEVQSVENQLWHADLTKLSNDELMRMYNVISSGRYEFARNAWYIPIGGDHRCPIMIAKGYKAPNTPERMFEFEGTAKLLEHEYRHFIDAWDFGYITEKDIEKAILGILELRNIEIIECTA